MKYFSILILVAFIATSCNQSTNDLEGLSKPETVDHNKKKKWKDRDGCETYPDCWANNDCWCGGCPDDGSSCRLLNRTISDEEQSAYNELTSAIDNGLEDVASYFNEEDYSELFGFLDEADYAQLKSDLRSGVKTVIYIPDGQYPPGMDTTNHYLYVGDTSEMSVTYSSDGNITDISNYHSKSVLKK